MVNDMIRDFNFLLFKFDNFIQVHGNSAPE